jgi:hypothetical protein
VEHAPGGVNVVVKGPMLVRDQAPVEDGDEEDMEEEETKL